MGGRKHTSTFALKHTHLRLTLFQMSHDAFVAIPRYKNRLGYADLASGQRYKQTFMSCLSSIGTLMHVLRQFVPAWEVMCALVACIQPDACHP